MSALGQLAAEVVADQGREPVCALCGATRPRSWEMCPCGLLLCAGCAEVDLTTVLGLCAAPAK